MSDSIDMRYRLCSKADIIGNTDLPSIDFGMAVATGVFKPTGEYSKVRSVFRMKTDASDGEGRNKDEGAMSRYRVALDELDLRIENSEGQVVPTGWIDIDDFSEEVGADDPEAFQISAHVTDLESLYADHLEEAKRAEAKWLSQQS